MSSIDSRAQRTVATTGSAGGLGKPWARSAGIALAFTVFASAMLCPSPVWLQTLLFVVMILPEGRDDVVLRIGG